MPCFTLKAHICSVRHICDNCLPILSEIECCIPQHKPSDQGMVAKRSGVGLINQRSWVWSPSMPLSESMKSLKTHSGRFKKAQLILHTISPSLQPVLFVNDMEGTQYQIISICRFRTHLSALRLRSGPQSKCHFWWGNCSSQPRCLPWLVSSLCDLSERVESQCCTHVYFNIHIFKT